MKIKNYEKIELITFIIIILIIIEIIGGVFLYNYKIYKYKTLTGIIFNDNLVTLIIDKNDKKIINSNRFIYLNNKKLKYKIEEDKGFIMKKNNKKYYEILINIKTPKNKKTNEVLEFTIKTKKERITKILKKIWEGG